MDMQKFMDIMSEQNRNTRSEYHLTLGQLCDFLSTVEDGNTLVKFDIGGYPCVKPKSGDPFMGGHSYRGYYSDFAIPIDKNEETVSGLLGYLTSYVLDKTFEGYKGGDYTMARDTPLWVAEWGIASQMAMIDVGFDNQYEAVVIRTKQLTK